MVKIALLVMVKDESKRIAVTLNSTVGVIDMVIVYDTGSMDNTIDIIKEFCDANKLPLHLKQGKFEDFATSRNTALDYAQEYVFDYLLLMDANDELRGKAELLKIAELELDTNRLAYFLNQHLEQDGTTISFFNVRLLKKECNWRYMYPVHETFESLTEKLPLIGKLPEVILYQDRAQDVEKSQARYSRDIELLQEYNSKHPEDSRIVFYLAQTYDSLKQFDKAYKTHKLRTSMGGSVEERFISSFRVACLIDDKDKAVMWYLKAYTLQPRAEPLLNICEYYRKINKPRLAYHFAKLSCELDYPANSFQYVDRRAYDYIRWAQLAATALPLKELDVGFNAALKAYEYSKSEYDRNLLYKYHQLVDNFDELD